MQSGKTEFMKQTNREMRCYDGYFCISERNIFKYSLEKLVYMQTTALLCAKKKKNLSMKSGSQKTTSL